MSESEKNYNTGWIRIYRSIKKHWIWKKSLYYQLWSDFLLRANHQENKILMESDLFTIQRGQFIISQLKLSEEYNCSRSVIRNFLKLLEKDLMIASKTTNKFTIITICNYDTYQNGQPTKEQQEDNKKTTRKQQEDTEKNEKNEKNEKEEIRNVLLLWNSFAKENNLSQIIRLSPKRIKHIKARIKESEFDIFKIFEKIKESNFLLGDNDRKWKVDFDFIFNGLNGYLKILEGKYGTKTYRRSPNFVSKEERESELKNLYEGRT